MPEPKPTFKVPVRALAEFTQKAGDLNSGTAVSVSGPEAIRIHKRIQKARPDGYESEVTVSFSHETDRLILEIGGRIDGVFTSEHGIVIDEIKTTNGDLEIVIQAVNRVHWGQARIYAFLYAAQNKLTSIDVQLTYYHVRLKEKREIRNTFSFPELEEFFTDVINAYASWIENQLSWREIRDESIIGAEFPFKRLRAGQEEMLAGVKRTLHAGERLLIHAPTGIGKTAAVLFPAVQNLSGKTSAKILFLTARTTGKAAAEETLDIFRSHGMKCRSITLTAKERICFQKDSLCTAEECLYARGYFDRINSALADGLNAETLGREAVESIAQKHNVCPFELSLEIARWSDVIIGDYNYAFDPRVTLSFLFEDKDKLILLIDEAHNLVDRGRDMFSAELVVQVLRTIYSMLPVQLSKMKAELVEVGKLLNSYKDHPERAGGEFAVKEAPEELLNPLNRFASTALNWLAMNERTEFKVPLQAFTFEVLAFLQILEIYDSTYTTNVTISANDVRIRLNCVDPAPHLARTLQKASASIFFSGTLVPLDYFARSLGCLEADTMNLASPYGIENVCVMIAYTLSTLYNRRQETQGEMARLLTTYIQQKPGNYLLYFPSFAYLKLIYEAMQPFGAGIRTIVQSPRMSEADRSVYIRQFHTDDGHLVGFAVLGGVFAESIDLIGERLTGAAVVGVGLPGLSLERDLIRAYYDEDNGEGFAYAYQIPGMIKVMQAAGRVIRSENDRGTVLLIGSRYNMPAYRMLLPEEWQPVGVDNESSLKDFLGRFWDGELIYK